MTKRDNVIPVKTGIQEEKLGNGSLPVGRQGQAGYREIFLVFLYIYYF